MKIICRDRRKQSQSDRLEGRAMGSVSADIDRLLGPKTYEELEGLEVQVTRKLDSNEPIDTDYWESLLKRLLVWKAKAKLKKVYQAVIDSRLQTLRVHQAYEAESLRNQLTMGLLNFKAPDPEMVAYDKSLDPEPMLQLRSEDKSLGVVEDETLFLQKVVSKPTIVFRQLLTS